MKVKMLASGSKGNSCLVMTDEVKILIDVGVSYQYLDRELSLIGLSPKDIDMVFITHVHSDHIKGLKVFLKKTGLQVSIPADMEHELREHLDDFDCNYLDDMNQFLDLSVELIHTSHDTDSSVGYIMESGGSSFVYVTDTGYINRKYLKRMVNKSLYVIESNHDEKMLMEGPYPYYLKQRVISDSGHLSNKTTSKYLSNAVGSQTKVIVLAHLSEKNNTEEKAYEEVYNKLLKTEFQGRILIAKQNESLELIEV